MPELAQRLCFDLADTLAGHLKFAAHLFQGAGAAVFKAEAQLQHHLLAGSEGREHVHELLLEQCERRGLRGRGRVVVGNEIAQMAVLFLANGGLQGHRLLRDLYYLAHLVLGNAHLSGDLLGQGLAAVFLQQLTGDADELVDGLHHMHRDADGAGLIRDRAGDGLADPPGGVGGKLIALAIVELFDSLDKAQVALLNKIQEQHAAAHIALCDGYDQPEVGFAQALLCLNVALLHVLCQLDLLICS